MFDYKIIESNYSDELEKLVKELMSKGWIPVGGVSTSAVVLPDHTNYEAPTEYKTYSQALAIFPDNPIALMAAVVDGSKSTLDIGMRIRSLVDAARRSQMRGIPPKPE